MGPVSRLDRGYIKPVVPWHLSTAYCAQWTQTAGSRLSWYPLILKISLKRLGCPRPGRPGPSSALELGRHLGREIGAMPIDPLAEREAREAGHANRRTSCLRRLLDHQRYFALLVDDKNLLE